MRDITNLNTYGNPMFAKGKCYAVDITLGYGYDGKEFTVQDVYEVPEDEQLYAEELQDSTVMSALISKAVGELNMDMRALEKLFAYKTQKDAETSLE